MVMTWRPQSHVAVVSRRSLMIHRVEVTAARVLFERLKKDATFAPRRRPSSSRVCSKIKASRDFESSLSPRFEWLGKKTPPSPQGGVSLRQRALPCYREGTRFFASLLAHGRLSLANGRRRTGLANRSFHQVQNVLGQSLVQYQESRPSQTLTFSQMLLGQHRIVSQ